MRRVYRHAATVAADGRFAIELDGKSLRTPAKAALAVPSWALAEAIAEEWLAQGGQVRPQTLSLTRLASTAIDLIAPRRAEIVAEIAEYAGTDLLCYRAAHPPELAQRQHQVWQPLLDWAALRYDAPLRSATGIVPLEQPAASLRAYEAAVAAYEAMALAGLNLATRACGSLVLALALAEGRIDADAAFAAAQLDESFEIERWGEDSEQTRGRSAVKEDIVLAARFIDLLRR
ncbi:MAG TPA: ATP12 family protein [Stellaceae bacterium]|nr:ATP12 family protein [Stellaceae bacterium]